MKKPINKILVIGLGIAGLLLIINVGAMFYLAAYLEDNIDELQKDISTSLGRPVQFEQGIELQWSMRPSVIIKGVRIGNPKWARGKHFVAAEHAVLEFTLTGLLTQHPDISLVVLEKADLILETSKDGKNNWHFGDSGSYDRSVLPEKISINNSRLSYLPAAGKEHSIKIEQLEIEGLANRDIDVEASIEYDKLPISVDMDSDSRVVIDARGDRPLRLAARIHRARETVDLKGIEIRVGKSVISGEARLPLSSGQGMQINLNSDSLDLTPYLADDGGDEHDMGNLLDYPLKPEMAKGLAGQVSVTIKQVRAGELLFENVILDVKIEAGQVWLSLKDNDGRINANLEVKPAASVWQVKFSQNSAVDIGELIESGSDRASRTQAPAALNINLSGSGKSWKTVLGSAQGRVNVKIGAGRLSDAMAELLPMGDVLDSLLTTIGTQDGEKDHSRLECAVLVMDVKDGVASSKNGLAIRTPAVNVLGGGSVNLATGEIEFHFKTARRKGIGISVKGVAENFVHLTGTLEQPRPEVNTAGFLIHGGAAWATGGVSLFYDSLAKRLTSAGNPCEIVEKPVK